MSEIVNPYIAGAPVTEQRMFFGREDIFQWIENSLTGQYAEHILVIHGQRRVGKTSVLKQLGNRLPTRYIPVFFDLQGRTHTTLDRFLWWLAREIVRVLKQERGLEIPVPDKDAFSADLEYFENHFLPGLHPALAGNTLLLTFDEFDNLEEGEIKEVLARPLIDYLRRMMGNKDLNFIFSIGSSGRKLENMQAAYTEFFKTALYKKISFLNEEQTHLLIMQPVKGILEYDRPATARIYQIAGGHPYFTQLICHELFARCQRTGQRRVQEADVEAVLEDVVERGTVNLKFVWDEASDIQKWGLSALAQMEGKVENRLLADFLKIQRVHFSETDLASGLLHLREKDVLTPDNRFVIHLMRLWLQKNRPIEQAREELTEANPITNRYIEIGLEFRESGQYERAIENFRQALSVSPENLQAQVSIALAYQAQGALEQAVYEFEKALALDDEDVASRSGLCEAHLTLGNSAMADGLIPEATRSYRRVLEINAEHTEARQRMADISHQRAKKAAAEGREADTLNALLEALKYTPEDPALNEELEVFKAGKKDRTLAALLARADREAKALNWEGVVAALADASALSPADGNIQSRLAEARQKLREQKLADLKARAQALANAEKFKEALKTWREYLALRPPDPDQVEKEIARITKEQELLDLYTNATQAMTDKDFEQATRLLKDVIIRDDNYKDASRLLTRAIELRRSAPGKKQVKTRSQRARLPQDQPRRKTGGKKNWWVRALLAILFLGVAGGAAWFAKNNLPAINALFGRNSLTPTNTAPIMSSRTPTHALTQTSTPTATSIPWSWKNLWMGWEVARDFLNGIVIDPGNPQVIYIWMANAGIYKSSDGGESWQPAHSGVEQASIKRLWIDLDDPQVVFTRTATDELYRTNDGGARWSRLEQGAGTIAMDPQNPGRVFLSSGTTLYESTDSGSTWTMVTENLPLAINDLFVSSQDRDRLYAAGNSSLVSSLDGGDTWTVTHPIPTEAMGARMFVNQSPDGKEYVYLYNDASSINLHRSFHEGCYAASSADGGATWKKATQITCRIDPDPAGGIIGNGIGSVRRSVDGGQTWQYLGEDPDWYVREMSTALAVSPQSPDILYAARHGLFISTNGGGSWDQKNNGLGGNRAELAISPDGTDLFLVGLYWGSGLWRSLNGGQWEPTPYLYNVGEITVDADGFTIYRMFLSFLIDDMYMRSSDQGDSWENISYRHQASDCSLTPTNLIAHPARSGVLYEIFQEAQGKCPAGVRTSEDGGNLWRELPNAWGNDNLDAAELYFGTGEAIYLVTDSNGYHSDDEGQSWGACADPEADISTTKYRFAIDPLDDQHVYLATSGQGILTSRDGCASWESTTIQNRYVNAIAINPHDPDAIYAGTDGGAYVSFDGGRSWGAVNDGLLNATVIYSMVVDKDNNVYAATPYGIFKLENK